jgi:hypothetical protein
MRASIVSEKKKTALHALKSIKETKIVSELMEQVFSSDHSFPYSIKGCFIVYFEVCFVAAEIVFAARL